MDCEFGCEPLILSYQQFPQREVDFPRSPKPFQWTFQTEVKKRISLMQQFSERHHVESNKVCVLDKEKV